MLREVFGLTIKHLIAVQKRRIFYCLNEILDVSTQNSTFDSTKKLLLNQTEFGWNNKKVLLNV